jgi:hypothetical protein
MFGYCSKISYGVVAVANIKLGILPNLLRISAYASVMVLIVLVSFCEFAYSGGIWTNIY